MNSLDNAFNLLHQMNEHLKRSAPRLLRTFPLETYQQLLTAHTQSSGYRDHGSAVVKWCEDIKKCAGDDSLGHYHRNLLVHLIVTRVACSRFPETVQTQYFEEFERMLEELSRNPSEWYSWDEDLFCKDVAICCCRMFPAGCLKTEIHSGVPRRMFTKVKPRELLSFSSLVLRLGGFGPFFEIHLDVRYRKKLTPEGWEYALRLVGQTLKMYPEVKGVTGASWFFDPAIAIISPHLWYLRQQIEENGGEFFYAGTNNRVIELATLASAARKKRFKDGSYIPASYMMIWSRENILKWVAL